MAKRELRLQPLLAMILGVVYLNVATASTDDGKTVYEQHCAPCHGVSGKGDGPAARALKPPPGTLATSPKAHSEAEVARVISDGTPHPSFAGKLSTDQIQAVAEYVKRIAGH